MMDTIEEHVQEEEQEEELASRDKTAHAPKRKAEAPTPVIDLTGEEELKDSTIGKPSSLPVVRLKEGLPPNATSGGNQKKQGRGQASGKPQNKGSIYGKATS